MFIDTTRRIAETLYFLLNGVDALQDNDLRYTFYLISHKIYNLFESGVDLVAESLTGQSLLDELFTDCLKSELMETMQF
ncbi:MAG: hypothetical protein V7K47_11225 [Nostoc sp.]